MNTSQEALESIKPHAAAIRERIVDYLKTQPFGATCDGVENALGLRHQTASARIYELAGKGKKPRPAEIKKFRSAWGPVRRETRSGCLADVWVVKEDSTDVC